VAPHTNATQTRTKRSKLLETSIEKEEGRALALPKRGTVEVEFGGGASKHSLTKDYEGS